MQLLLLKAARGNKLKRDGRRCPFLRISRRFISTEFPAGEIIPVPNKCVVESDHATAISHHLVRFQKLSH